MHLADSWKKHLFMKGEPIPRHFQEAGLLLADKDRYIAFLLFHTAGDGGPIPGIQAGFGTICQPSGCVLDISTIWRYLLVLFLFQDL